MPALIPRTYEQWRHCIERECGIPLTATFIAQRLATWRNPEAEETRRFRKRYGDAHWQAVLHWFEQAAQEAQTENAQPEPT